MDVVNIVDALADLDRQCMCRLKQLLGSINCNDQSKHQLTLKATKIEY